MRKAYCINFFFVFQSPCSNLPCKNNGKCISLYEKNSYVCACKKIFTGKHCENCKETAEKTIGSFGKDIIDDGESAFEIVISQFCNRIP